MVTHDRARVARLGLVLCVLPLLYAWAVPQIPAARELFGGDRSQWGTFWRIAATTEWLSLALVGWLWRVRDGTQPDLGLRALTQRQILAALGVIAGALLVAIVGAGGQQDFLSRMPSGLAAFIPPPTLQARLGWVAMSLTAAICEEVLWRGVAITDLRSIGCSTSTSVLISSFAFAYFHGGFAQGGAVFVWRFGMGLLFAGLFVRSRSLYAPVLAHFIADASALMAIQVD